MKRLLAIIILPLLFVVPMWAQLLDPEVQQPVSEFPTNYFRHPLNCEVSLTGTFAEIRANHYHSGIDLRIGGKIGEPVYAAADGFVSRINISAWGGGKVLYIDHPNGFRTVYMHLNDFVGDIGTFVEEYQHSHQCYSFDVNVPEGKISVHKGQLVAHAGNTGSSGGPHLHYEIRYANNDQTINPLYFGFRYKDNVDPVIRGIKIYPDNAQPFQLVGDTVRIGGRFYTGIYATDLSEPGSGKNGVEKIELYVDDSLFFLYHNRTFRFEETRSVNAIIDYPQYQLNREYYILTRRLSGLRISHHQPMRDDGYLCFASGELHRLTYKVSDLKGNSVSRTFFVRSVDSAPVDSRLIQMTQQGVPIYFARENVANYPNFEIKMPPYAVYDDDFLIYNAQPDSRFLSQRHSVGLKVNSLPPHQSVRIRIAIPSTTAVSPNKMVIVSVRGSRLAAVTTKAEGRWLTASVKDFGDYAVTQDCEAPVVKPVNFASGKEIIEGQLRVKITDNLSGIADYDCYVDGKWVLAEHDGKTSSIYIDTRRISKGTRKLRVTVTDACGNTADKTYTIVKN